MFSKSSKPINAPEIVHSDTADENEWARRVAAWSPEERAAKEKKFVRKIDLRLLPILVRISDSRSAQPLFLIIIRSSCTS